MTVYFDESLKRDEPVIPQVLDRYAKAQFVTQLILVFVIHRNAY